MGPASTISVLARALCAASWAGPSSAIILIAHEISGKDAKAHLPEPAILLVVITTVLGVLFGMLGGWLRARAERMTPTADGGALRSFR